MRVAIYVVADAPREIAIARAFQQGCAVHGDVADIVRLSDYAGPQYDVAVLVGRSLRRVFADYLMCGRPVLIVEKGQFARKAYERVEIWGWGYDDRA